MDVRNRQILFNGLVVAVEQLEVRVGRRGWHTFQVVRHPGGVGVLPLHPDGTVTLIRQLRATVGDYLLEIPAGRRTAGEEPAEAAVRELAEETGLAARQLEPLGPLLSSPGVFDETIHLFLATGLTQGEAAPEQYEEIEPVRLPLAEALELARTGGISDAKTIAALFRAAGRGR